MAAPPAAAAEEEEEEEKDDTPAWLSLLNPNSLQVVYAALRYLCMRSCVNSV